MRAFFLGRLRWSTSLGLSEMRNRFDIAIAPACAVACQFACCPPTTLVHRHRRTRLRRARLNGMGSDVPRSIEDVQNDDAAFRAREAEGPAVVPEVEGAELKRLLADARVCERCVSVAGDVRWSGCAEARRRASELSNEVLGSSVEAVMRDLDAAHLRPTGIRRRLDDGVDAACHGLVTLLANLRA